MLAPFFCMLHAEWCQRWCQSVCPSAADIGSESVHRALHSHTRFQGGQIKRQAGNLRTSNVPLGPSKPSFFAEEPRLPLPFWTCRPSGRHPRLVLLLEPAVDEGPDQGAGRDTASEALAAQARVDAFFEAHRHRPSQGSHLCRQPYTSRPPPATDRSGPTRYPEGDGSPPSWLRLRKPTNRQLTRRMVATILE